APDPAARGHRRRPVHRARRVLRLLVRRPGGHPAGGRRHGGVHRPRRPGGPPARGPAGRRHPGRPLPPRPREPRRGGRGRPPAPPRRHRGLPRRRLRRPGRPGRPAPVRAPARERRVRHPLPSGRV
ncbi:MAG: hypothetical protein AVDCRST_MAG48-3527, partial [uncultured Friedmanniella sp.]